MTYINRLKIKSIAHSRNDMDIFCNYQKNTNRLHERIASQWDTQWGMMWTSCMKREIVSGCHIYMLYRCLVSIEESLLKKIM